MKPYLRRIMNTQTNDTTVPTLDEAIINALRSLEKDDPVTDDYTKVVDQLAKLYKMKEIENNYNLKLQEMNHNYAHGEVEHDLKSRELDNFDRLSKAQLATILANLAGIAVIMTHERTHIIVTKALGFVSKLK
jgi:hypothetical protein